MSCAGATIRPYELMRQPPNQLTCGYWRRNPMRTLAMISLSVFALLGAAAPTYTWHALSWADDSEPLNRPREHWFRGPDGRLHPVVQGMGTRQSVPKPTQDAQSPVA